MNGLLLMARLLLSGIFGVAGGTKLVDRVGARQALTDFGAPTRLAPPLAYLLPLSELTVAGALLFPGSSRWGALGALGLLLIFSVAIGLTLARGQRPPCHCFGQIHSTPVGRGTLFRNGLFAAIAGFVLWRGSTVSNSAIGWPHLTAFQLGTLLGLTALFAFAITEGWFLLQLLQQHGRLLLRLDDLEQRLVAAPQPLVVAPATSSATPGLNPTRAPAFQLPDLNGNLYSLETLRAAGKPVLLLFADPNCGPCHSLLPDIARWQRHHPSQVTIALISRGAAELNRAKYAEYDLRNVLLQQDFEVAQRYQIAGTPSAILIRPDGSLGSPVATGIEAVQALVAETLSLPLASPPRDCGCGQPQRQAMERSSPTAGLPMGQPVPGFTLPDLFGQPTALTEFRGRSILLLFWNPGCGYCTRMLDDMKAWEAQTIPEKPTLIVISAGSVTANQALGFRASVLLDQEFQTGRTLGVSGTPAAVLVDAEGRVASPLLVGAAQILAFANSLQDRLPVVHLN